VTRLILVAMLVLASTAPCVATTVVPMTEADLASEAAAVVVGRVTALQSHFDAARGQIFTDVTLAVDEIIAGPPLPPTVTLRQPGGQVGNVRTWIEGSPEFVIGERVLVYLKEVRDGTLRVLQLYQGKLSVMIDPLTGDEIAIRITGGGVHVLPPARGATSLPKDTHRLDDLRQTIRAARAPPLSSLHKGPIPTAPAAADVVQQQDAFVFLGAPSRWFEVDGGAAIKMAINSTGQAQAPTRGFDQIRQGFAAWSHDPEAKFRYADGGFTSAAGLRFDGVNVVSFDDPDGIMDPPVNCSGTLAMGGFSRSTAESRVVNGTTFVRILDGDVVFNDGWQGCGFYETFGNFAEVATHELGHVLGLGHSTDPTATMFASAHFDGRGASLKADDLAGLRFIYPATAAHELTLGFTAPANGATVSGATTVSVAATGGRAPYAYRVSLDSTSIATSASFSWNTPAVIDGAHALSATVTDADGRRASASIRVTVANGGGGGGGTLRVAITQPTSGATVSGVPSAVMWVEGANAASVTFTLTLAGRTMGSTTTPSRGPISMPYDTRVVANGRQPLTATVRDAAGNSATTTVSVIVQNAAAAPSPRAGAPSVFITSPLSGVTVSGTVWVNIWVERAAAGVKVSTLRAPGRGRGSISLAVTVVS
jgi:Matrixin